MEQIRKIAKTINRYFGVIKFITIASTILVTLAILWLLTFDEALLSNAVSSLSLNWLTIEFNQPLFSSKISIKVYLITLLIIAYIGIILFIQLITIIKNILNVMIEETIFKTEMANQIMNLSQLCFIYGVYTNMSNFLSYRFYMDHSNLRTLLETGNIAKVSTSFIFDINFLLLSALIYLLSYIFRYGVELQQLSDETL